MKNILRIILLIFIVVSINLSATNLNAESFSPFAIEKLTGKKAPEFTAKDLSGKDVSLSLFAGKPILLNFWATWCPYCREERPYLNSLYKSYKDKGLVIIAVSTDRSLESVKRYLKKIPMDFVILHDSDGNAAGIYGAYSIPTSFLIDRKGIIKHKFMGLVDWTDKSSIKFIDELLKE